ncbi:hypothetical protein IE53DRAFT_367497 [Violaceomyces palustris]|uniref:Uncharacterized protein n=1 Tax=Violaceomyces palustris TaxID=1673888 RepID=A0ACD0P216_9BASI|nr:hypothetical protein IE53DRAFT_367497 [Violaceomyces palustris]
MSSAAADFGFRRMRVAKACVVCRMRKTKCNGEQPCDGCRSHGATCTYAPPTNRQSRQSSDRAVSSAHGSSPSDSPGANPSGNDREGSEDLVDRPRKRAQTNDGPSSSYSAAAGSRSRPGKSMAERLAAQQQADECAKVNEDDGIRAHDETTGNMQFYGFTSNFNFQHRLLQTIQSLKLREQFQDGANRPQQKRAGSTSIPDSMTAWGHQNIIFRVPHSRPSVKERSFPTLGDARQIGDPTYLHPRLVDRFMDNYYVLVHPEIPVIPRQLAQRWVHEAGTLSGIYKRVCSIGLAPQNTLKGNELSTLYMLLALGASVDEGDPPEDEGIDMLSKENAESCSNTFFLQAKRRLEELLENSSVTSAKCLLLMGFWSLQWSNPNVAYLYLGYASRMCIAIGLHREASFPPSNPRSLENRRLWWSCYCLERRISTWFGQASNIRDDDVTTRLPFREDEVYLKMNSQMAQVCADVSRLCSKPPTDSEDLVSLAKLMDLQMLKIRDEGSEEYNVGFWEGRSSAVAHSQQQVASDVLVCRYSLNTFWWYLRIIIYSPLSIFALYLRSAGQPIPPNILSASHKAGSLAKELVDNISLAIDLKIRPSLNNLKFTSFYLDSACSILLAAILIDPSSDGHAFDYMAGVDRAIKHMEATGNNFMDHGTKASLAKARDVANLARQVIQAAAKDQGRRGGAGEQQQQHHLHKTAQSDEEEQKPSIMDKILTATAGSFSNENSAFPPTVLPSDGLTDPVSSTDSTNVAQGARTDPVAVESDWMEQFMSSFDWLAPMQQQMQQQTQTTPSLLPSPNSDLSPPSAQLQSPGEVFSLFSQPGGGATGELANGVPLQPNEAMSLLNNEIASLDMSMIMVNTGFSKGAPVPNSDQGQYPGQTGPPTPPSSSPPAGSWPSGTLPSTAPPSNPQYLPLSSGSTSPPWSGQGLYGGGQNQGGYGGSASGPGVGIFPPSSPPPPGLQGSSGQGGARGQDPYFGQAGSGESLRTAPGATTTAASGNGYGYGYGYGYDYNYNQYPYANQRLPTPSNAYGAGFSGFGQGGGGWQGAGAGAAAGAAAGAGAGAGGVGAGAGAGRGFGFGSFLPPYNPTPPFSNQPSNPPGYSTPPGYPAGGTGPGGTFNLMTSGGVAGATNPAGFSSLPGGSGVSLAAGQSGAGGGFGSGGGGSSGAGGLTAGGSTSPPGGTQPGSSGSRGPGGGTAGYDPHSQGYVFNPAQTGSLAVLTSTTGDGSTTSQGSSPANSTASSTTSGDGTASQGSTAGNTPTNPDDA